MSGIGGGRESGLVGKELTIDWGDSGDAGLESRDLREELNKVKWKGSGI